MQDTEDKENNIWETWLQAVSGLNADKRWTVGTVRMLNK